MRHRYQTSPGVAELTCECQGWSRKSNLGIPVDNPYNGIVSSTYMEKSTIDDELSSRGSSLIAHPVVHTRASASMISQKFSLWGGPGHSWFPVATCSPRLSVLYEPATPSYQIDWGAAIDTLAKLVDTGISNGAMIGATLRELRSTIAMIRNPFGIFERPAWNWLRKQSLSLHRLRRISGLQLEYQYGWRSLEYDVETISKVTAANLLGAPYRQLEEQARRYSSRGHLDLGTQDCIEVYSPGSFQALASSSYIGTASGFGGQVRLRDVRSTVDYCFGCTQLLEAYNRARQTRALLASYGVASWRDLRDTLWEVLPYSFVADWFVDTRGIWAPLNAERLYQGDISRLCYSTKYRVEYKAEWVPHNVSSLYGYGPWPWPYQSQYKTGDSMAIRCSTPGYFQRYTRTLGIPDATAFYSTIAAKGLSSVQTLNGLCLIAQRFAKNFFERPTRH